MSKKDSNPSVFAATIGARVTKLELTLKPYIGPSSRGTLANRLARIKRATAGPTKLKPLPPCLLKSITAEHHNLEVLLQRNEGRDSQVKRNRWWHDPEEPIPDKFSPLAMGGTIRIMAVIFSDHAAPDEKRLQKKARRKVSTVWVVREDENSKGVEVFVLRSLYETFKKRLETYLAKPAPGQAEAKNPEPDGTV